ncbi:hypothetical protein [Aquimarina sp. RZ0]|uniref:hypothetical protein n=1 Tax=Aquimarina sp. RZ0 TaxID=2607730 RepID=UPI0011F32796|nr:hypothetical protein [Aquimarina sp. RZ0]KAA1245009.1 hypothetical protein F0000_14135 [Aquimarina sp. RZ0]
MKKSIITILLISIGFMSCKNSEGKIDKLEIAKRYYHILNNSNHYGLSPLIADSIVTIESDYNYKQTFSKNEYIEWQKWDAVFEPTYEILQIEQHDQIIKAKILKMDKRIFFLQEEPFITNQTIRFRNNKISAVETNYVNFKEKIWGKNKNELVGWIDKNHPELNGFIYDQTEKGALRYLKAIELYKHRK